MVVGSSGTTVVLIGQRTFLEIVDSEGCGRKNLELKCLPITNHSTSTQDDANLNHLKGLSQNTSVYTSIMNDGNVHTFYRYYFWLFKNVSFFYFVLLITFDTFITFLHSCYLNC